MRTQADKEKQLYCQLAYESDRLRSLRYFFRETHDDRIKGHMTKAANNIRKVVDELSQTKK